MGGAWIIIKFSELDELKEESGDVEKGNRFKMKHQGDCNTSNRFTICTDKNM